MIESGNGLLSDLVGAVVYGTDVPVTCICDFRAGDR